MEPDAGEYIRKVLEPGEELLWAGRPRAGIRINTRGKSFRLTLATLVLIVTILALGRFFNDGRYFDTGVFVAFFLFLFLWIAASPMLMDIHGPTGVDYGLTNQRAIVFHRTSSEESKSFSIQALRSIHFDNHWDGRATLYAAIAAPDWTTANPRFPQPLFYFIDDHERLYSQLTELRPDLGIDPAELWTDPRGYMRTMLEPGEELLWAGQPHVGLHIETSEKYWYLLPAIWIISLLLASPLFVAYWYGWEGALVSFGFLILAIIAGSVLLWKASRLRNDCYGVTDRRVLTVNRRFDGRPFGIPITSLRSIDQIRHADGTTSITCESDSIEWPRDSESLRPTCRPLFRHIDNGEHVYSLLKELQPGVFDEVAGLAARDTRYLNQLLQPNEHLHWFERPPTGLRRQGNDLLQALMALLLIIAPIVCIKAAIDTHDARREGIGEVSGGATTFIVVAGAVLMLKGLHLLFIRYFRDAGFRNSVLYALTNQRAISAKHPNQYGTSVRSVFLDSIADVEIAWEHDGRGAISCRGEALDWKIPNASQGSFRKLRVNGPLFRSVESPERVSALMASSKAAPPTPLAVYSASSIGAVTERLPGETLRWTGTSDDPGSRDRIAAWFVQFLRWTRNQLELLGALNKVAQRLTSVLRNAPIHRTRNLAYMLTERRVVIIDWTHEERSRRIPLDSLDQLFLQTDRDGKETIFGRSSVRDWPYRYPAGKPVAGPLFPGTDTPETISPSSSQL